MSDQNQQAPFTTYPITYRPEQAEPTFVSIIRKKYLVMLEETAFRHIAIGCSHILLTVLLSALLVFPRHTGEALAFLIGFYGYALPKCLLAVTIVIVIRNRKALLRFFRGVRRQPNQHTIEGVPVAELLDFLFVTEGFRLAEATKAPLYLGKKAYERLAPKLEELGILIRGEKNSRILNPDLSREEIAATLKTGTSARDLTRPLRIVQNGSRNFRSKAEIEAA